MSLTLYYAPMTSATRIYWALEELGVPYEKVKLDLAAGDQKKPAYLALNPNGKVPLLVEDGVPIFESLAILLHLGERYGTEKGLYPAPGLKRAEALRWMVWATASLSEAGSRLVRNVSDRFPAEERNAAAAERAKTEIGEHIAMIESALADRPYLLGDAFSFVDVSIAGFLPFFSRFGVDMSPYKNVQAWLGRCMARPGLAKAMQG